MSDIAPVINQPLTGSKYNLSSETEKILFTTPSYSPQLGFGVHVEIWISRYSDFSIVDFAFTSWMFPSRWEVYDPSQSSYIAWPLGGLGVSLYQQAARFKIGGVSKLILPGKYYIKMRGVYK
jgi:hypothetical protein